MQAKPTVTFKQQRNEVARPAVSRRIVRASELAQYSYCAKAWWLGSVLGKPSANTREMQSGTDAHQQHGRAVWLSLAMRIVALALVVVALFVLLMALTLR